MGRSRVTEPPWDSATSFTIDRPRPDPGRCRASFARQKRSNTRGASSTATPGPWSRTEISPFATVTSTVAPAGLYFAALSRRFVIARATRTFTPLIDDGVAVTLKRTLGYRNR